MKYQKPSQNMSSTSNQPGRINFKAKKYKLPYVGNLIINGLHKNDSKEYNASKLFQTIWKKLCKYSCIIQDALSFADTIEYDS